MQSLNGTADVAVSDGAVIGFNLGGAMRELSEGNIPDFDGSPSEKTDFSELTGSFVIANGIATNDDLKLASPLLHATGAGTVDLPQRSLDYTVRPKLVASLGGEGGESDARRHRGPRAHHRAVGAARRSRPTSRARINNPSTVDAVKEIGKQLKGKNAGEIVQDLFGKGEDGEPSKAREAAR